MLPNGANTVDCTMENTAQLQTSRNILRNVLYGLSTWVLPLGLSFFATPLILRTMGSEEYGIYALVSGIIAYSFGLNLGRAITKYVAEYRISGETHKINDLIAAVLFINLIFGIAANIIFLFGSRYMVVDILQVVAESQERAVTALYIAGVTIFFAIFNQLFSSILQGVHRFDIYSKVSFLNSVALTSGNIILALKGYGLISLFVWNLFATIIFFLIFLWSAKRCLPEFKLTLRFSREAMKISFKFSSVVMGYQALANLFLLFERGWITRKLGAESLTYYVIPMTLSVYIHSFIGSGVMVVFPLASELKDEREKLLRLYRKATRAVCFLVVFAAGSVIVHSRDFITLWMNAGIAENTYLILIIHTITFSLLAIQTIAWQMTEGLGYPQFNTLINAICLAINLVLLLSLTADYGLNGIALARLAGYIFIFLTLFYSEKRFFGGVQFDLWKNILLKLGAAMVVSVLFQEFISHYFPLSWLWFLVSTGGGGILYCLLLWLSNYATADEKLLLINLLKRRSAA